VQDSVDIFAHLEAHGVRLTAKPPGLKQQLLAHIVELYGSLGMTRHAMHYRWSYLADQEAFLLDAFGAAAGTDAAVKVMSRMASFLRPLGVAPATVPLIEGSFEALLSILEAHFARHPYLLGAQPSLGDYGLLGPMFAHLGRDPVPAGIMKRKAPKVFRWVERMTAPGLDTPEFAGYGTDFLLNDQIPQTLEPLFQHIASEILPMLTDKLAVLDALVAEHDPQDGQPVAPKPHQRNIGLAETHFRGIP